MAYYLVRATPKPEKLAELGAQLARRAFVDMQPFGPALSKGLTGARRMDDGRAVWEEEDYYSPPLAMERGPLHSTSGAWQVAHAWFWLSDKCVSKKIDLTRGSAGVSTGGTATGVTVTGEALTGAALVPGTARTNKSRSNSAHHQFD